MCIIRISKSKKTPIEFSVKDFAFFLEKSNYLRNYLFHRFSKYHACSMQQNYTFRHFHLNWVIFTRKKIKTKKSFFCSFLRKFEAMLKNALYRSFRFWGYLQLLYSTFAVRRSRFAKNCKKTLSTPKQWPCFTIFKYIVFNFCLSSLVIILFKRFWWSWPVKKKIGTKSNCTSLKIILLTVLTQT